MDFLDSLDLETTNKKSGRVRSWYLYEQYKSLERNQLEATQKLKDKSYQDRILRQELSERRARRKLYDQFGLCESEARIERKIKSAEVKSSQTVISSEDLFDSYCELHEEDENLSQVTEVGSSHDTFSHDDLLEQPFSEDYKSVIDSKDNSHAASVESVVEISEHSKNIADDDKELARSNIVKSLTEQLESVKEDIQCLENYTKLSDSKSIDEDSVVSLATTKNTAISKILNEYDSKIFAIWSKLVSFAYQVIRLNHGNCYYDYSSQLMTAVLACDMLRRGINRMCYILQPYVSPIKYADDSVDFNEIHKYSKRKMGIKSVPSMKHRKLIFNQLQQKNKAKTVIKRPHFECTHQSENWRPYSKYSFENLKTKCRRASEPMRGVTKFFYKGRGSEKCSCSSIWPEFSKENVKNDLYSKCLCSKSVYNPTLQMARYIDSILQDIDDVYV